MLNQATVDREEEELRQKVRQLEDQQRAAFYASIKPKLRDPDTYAALNWFFVTGIHHFYLGRWVWGIIDLLVFIFGIALILGGYVAAGIVLILTISALELWALFRSQIIVQDQNNQIYREELDKIGVSSH